MSDTRQQILEKNFEAIHKNGFQGTRTDKVITDLGITKGAFYHYFPSKTALGYAVVDEIIAPQYISTWRQLDNLEDHPIDGIIRILDDLKNSFSEEQIQLGCPLNNLIQEMAPLDEGFQMRLNQILDEMHGAIARALQRATDNIQLSVIVAPADLAHFILAALEGSFSIGKSRQSKLVFDRSIDQLIRYLRSLKR